MRLWLTVLAALFLTLSLRGDEVERSIDVYLLIGQSNMAGRAELSESDRGPIAGALLFNGEGEWEPAENPLNRFSTIRKDIKMQRMGPGYGFARGMHVLDPGREIGLVVNAKGGSAVAEWQPDQVFFAEAVARTKAALEMPGTTLKGILWHQGEADVSNENYLRELAHVIAELRRALDADNVPFVAGQLFAPSDQPARIGFNERLTEIHKYIPDSAYVSSETLTATDTAHFDSPSMRLLGLRYAERMISLRRQGE
ncbi:MAG: sialate O-acetylesterase [Verrucomicrobiales bacterium]|nr:sialate O-acetylesterase [Verrucomicrobiales bacterium]